jgi:hypothetical protein
LAYGLNSCGWPPRAFLPRSNAIEDIGRHRIVRTRMLGHSVTALLQEHEPIPADPHLYFEPEGVAPLRRQLARRA